MNFFLVKWRVLWLLNDHVFVKKISTQILSAKIFNFTYLLQNRLNFRIKMCTLNKCTFFLVRMCCAWQTHFSILFVCSFFTSSFYYSVFFLFCFGFSVAAQTVTLSTDKMTVTKLNRILSREHEKYLFVQKMREVSLEHLQCILLVRWLCLPAGGPNENHHVHICRFYMWNSFASSFLGAWSLYLILTHLFYPKW